MGNTNIDVIRVYETAANLPATLIAGQWGYDTTNDRIAVKRLADSTMIYFENQAAGAYVKADGTVPLTANWDVGDFNISNINNLDCDRLAAGQAAVGYYNHILGGAITSDGASTVAAGVVISIDVTGNDGDTTRQALLIIGDDVGASITTQSESETIGVVAGAYFSDPAITKGTDTVTTAATVYIKDAPTEGATNAALYVAAGNVISMGTSGFGVSDPDTKVEILNAGNQLKLSYDGTDNCVFAVDDDGDLTVTPSGADVNIVGKINVSAGASAYTAVVAPALAKQTTMASLYCVNTAAGAGLGNYGGMVGFSAAGANSLRSAIVAKQTGSDQDQMGIEILTHSSTSSTDLIIGERINHNGNIDFPNDGAVLSMGADSEVTITHVHNVGISLAGDMSITGGLAVQGGGVLAAGTGSVNYETAFGSSPTAIDGRHVITVDPGGTSNDYYAFTDKVDGQWIIVENISATITAFIDNGETRGIYLQPGEIFTGVWDVTTDKWYGVVSEFLSP